MSASLPRDLIFHTHCRMNKKLNNQSTASLIFHIHCRMNKKLNNQSAASSSAILTFIDGCAAEKEA
jgi:hypothetical protein